MTDLAQLENLLDDVQQALIAGNYSALRLASTQLEQALTQLAPNSDRAELERLRRKADRNAACALAAGRGIRAAQHRLAEIRQAAAGLVTYDEKGRRNGTPAAAALHRRY